MIPQPVLPLLSPLAAKPHLLVQYAAKLRSIVFRKLLKHTAHSLVNSGWQIPGSGGDRRSVRQ